MAYGKHKYYCTRLKTLLKSILRFIEIQILRIFALSKINYEFTRYSQNQAFR